LKSSFGRSKKQFRFFFMANIDLLPPEIDPQHPTPVLRPAVAEPHLSGEIKEEGIFASLVSSFRDVFFPAKLPPLVLQSKPIAVPDRMATKRSPTSTAVAVGLHVLAIALIAFLVAKHVQIAAPHPQIQVTQLNVPVPPPPVLPRAEKIGGGGGQHDLAPVTQGHLPKLAQTQIVPPKAPPTIAPKLAIEPTVVVQKDLKLADNTMPNLGMPNSTLKGFSMGNGSGTGIGSGNGNGIGPGSGGNIGGGPMHIGGSVRAPVLVYQVDPEFSEEARKAKFSGNVEVYLWVDEQGNPSHVRVVRGVGMGLDEKAVEAVRQYKFKPAMSNGKPVKVDMYVDVNFQIF
jgi:protein TonB